MFTSLCFISVCAATYRALFDGLRCLILIRNKQKFVEAGEICGECTPFAGWKMRQCFVYNILSQYLSPYLGLKTESQDKLMDLRRRSLSLLLSDSITWGTSAATRSDRNSFSRVWCGKSELGHFFHSAALYKDLIRLALIRFAVWTRPPEGGSWCARASLERRGAARWGPVGSSC